MFQGVLPNGVRRQDLILYYDFLGDDPRDKFTGALASIELSMTYGVFKNNSKSATVSAAGQGIALATDVIGTGNITACFFMKIASYGASSFGSILDNGKFILKTDGTSSNNRLAFASDGATLVSSATSSIAINTEYFIALTRTSAGVANLYVNGVLSGSADQASGTPANGSTALVIFNDATTLSNMDGVLRLLQIYNKILTLDQIRQIYNKFK